MEIQLKPFAKHYLDLLKSHGIPCAVATATYRDMADSVLKKLGVFENFKCVLTCEEIGKPKTYPDIFLKAAERLGTAPEDTAVFEDALHCIETAKSAGFCTVGVFDAMASEDWDEITQICDRTVRSFEELLSAETGMHTHC
jgi:beta-phosphoglucomutase-like phosphatase (HAD superfamily)